MTLTLYSVNCTNLKVDKTNYLTQKSTLTGIKILEPSNLFEPSFIVTASNDIWQSNYCYLDLNGRYYYINDITALSGGRFKLDCKTDVLYTFKDSLLNSDAWITRSSKTSNGDEWLLCDSQLPFRADYKTTGTDFPTQPFGATTNNILLILSP